MKIKQLTLALAMILSVVSCKEEISTPTPDLLVDSSEKSFATMAVTGFVHPGISNGRGELDFIKQKVNTIQEPWKSGYDEMMKFEGSSLSFTTQGFATIWTSTQAGQNPAATTNEMGKAAHAAYSHALQWYITGNQANAQKSIELLNAWTVLTSVKSATGDFVTQYRLHTGQYAPIWAAAAEIIRYSNAGWAAADITKFESLLGNVFYPIIDAVTTCSGYSTPGCAYTDNPEFTTITDRAANWETLFAQSKMAIGVFTNDQAKFDNGKDLWLWLIKRTVYPSGQLGEACRDCAHSEMGLMGMIEAAEIAWQQGIDLYGTENSRLSLGMEWYAKTLLGIAQTKVCAGSSSSTDCSGTGSGKIPGWETGYNHYVNRAGKSMPSSGNVITQIMRPEPYRWNFLSWNTLTHAMLPLATFNKALNKPVTFSGQQTGNEATRAVDDNLNTPWAVQNFPQWIEVDLGSSISISKTEIVPLNNRAYKYKIEAKTSSTGAYTTIVNKTTNTTGGPVLSATFTPVNARYVKLTITGCSGSGCSPYNWISVNEFRVF